MEHLKLCKILSPLNSVSLSYLSASLMLLVTSPSTAEVICIINFDVLITSLHLLPLWRWNLFELQSMYRLLVFNLSACPTSHIKESYLKVKPLTILASSSSTILFGKIYNCRFAPSKPQGEINFATQRFRYINFWWGLKMWFEGIPREHLLGWPPPGLKCRY